MLFNITSKWKIYKIAKYGSSGRTSRIVKLAMDAAKIIEDQIETDYDPILYSGR